MTNFKRTKQIDANMFASFDGINYSVYHKNNSGVVDAHMTLTIEDMDKINEFVYICEAQVIKKDSSHPSYQEWRDL